MGLNAFTSVHWRDTKLRARSDLSRDSSDRVSTEARLPGKTDRQDRHYRYAAPRESAVCSVQIDPDGPEG